MAFQSAQYIASCAKPSQWPETTLPEIVFAGRSNAGKSSLINSLLRRKKLAYTGKTPGKTQLLNFFEIDGKVIFVDSPGYGFAKGGNQSALVFGKLMEPYFKYRETLKCLLLVLDIRRIPNEDDLAMVQYAKENHLAIIVACCKSDKVSNNEIQNQLRKISETLDIPKTQLYPCSSLKKSGLEELTVKIEETLKIE